MCCAAEVHQGNCFYYHYFSFPGPDRFFVWDSSKIATQKNSGNFNSGIRFRSDSTAIFSWVDAEDFITAHVPSRDDTLISINRKPATSSVVLDLMNRPMGIDQKISITFLHDGVPIEATMKTTQTEQFDTVAVIALHLLRYLISLSFILVGFWAFLKRPAASAVLILVLYCFAMAAFMLANVRILGDGYATFQIPYYNTILTILRVFTALTGAFWLNLQLVFPRPGKFITRYGFWAYLICYTPALMIILARLLQNWNINLPVNGLLIFIGYFILGLFLLIRNYLASPTKLEKRQVKLVLWGSGVGLILIMLYDPLLSLLLRIEWIDGPLATMTLANLTFLLMLLSPLSFAYAFGKYGLLEVEGKLRRGTRFLLVTVFMLVIFLAMVYGTGEVLLRVFNIESRTPTLLFAIVLALGFSPAQRRVYSFLESRFYPERHQLRLMIRDYLQQILSLPDQSALWTQLENRLRSMLNIERVFPVLLREDGSLHLFMDEAPLPFDEESPFIEIMKQEGRPLLVDELVESSRVILSDLTEVWLTDEQIAVILPMVSRSRLVGFLALGFKREKDDYSGEELQILRTLSSQVAMAYENIRLLEENIEKRRLEEQLQIARTVQEGFLPQEIPETPGLEVAARSRFCLEVAGDYFDVINVGDGKTILAVGDVSGKGAGAALLMANLQASLRTAVRIGGKLSEIVSGINDLIVQNTSPEEYITFFVGIYDVATREFTYVNAGHNPRLSSGRIKPVPTCLPVV